MLSSAARRPREPGRVWVEAPAPDLECSVCQDVFNDPVSLPCGHTFCRVCAVSWFAGRRGRLCPVARCAASAGAKPAELPTQFVVRSVVDALRVRCRHGLREAAADGVWEPDPDGCPAHLRLSEASAHEATCEYALEVCSFACCGVQRRRRDADAHDAVAAARHARAERDAREALEARVAAGEAKRRSEGAAFEARLAALEAICAANAAAPRDHAPVAPPSRLPTGARLRRTLVGHTSTVAACAWSADGAFLASCSCDATLRLWNAASGAERAVLRGHQRQTRTCCFSPDSCHVFSGDNRQVRMWSVADGTCTRTFCQPRRTCFWHGRESRTARPIFLCWHHHPAVGLAHRRTPRCSARLTK